MSIYKKNLMRIRITEEQHQMLINEIGEAGMSGYEWERTTNTTYEFQTENDNYIVEFRKIPEAIGEEVNESIIAPTNNGGRINTDNMWSLYFTTGSIDYQHALQQTNKANVYKVSSTVMSILKDFMEKNNVDLIGISTTEELGYSSEEESTRAKLYRSMAKKHAPPEWNIEDIDTNRFVVYNTEALEG